MAAVVVYQGTTHDGRDSSAGPLVIISPSDVVKAAAKVLYSLEKRYAT